MHPRPVSWARIRRQAKLPSRRTARRGGTVCRLRRPGARCSSPPWAGCSSRASSPRCPALGPAATPSASTRGPRRWDPGPTPRSTPRRAARASTGPNRCPTPPRSFDCKDQHRFEVAEAIDMRTFPGTEYGPDAAPPTDARIRQISQEQCQAAARQYLGERYDPNGRFSVSLVWSGDKAWRQAGERRMLCGLQLAGPDNRQLAFAGKVADVDQSKVWPAGTCLGIDPATNQPTDVPIDCVKPHAMEVTGAVNLGQQFPGPVPPDGDQDQFVKDTCTKMTDAYLAPVELRKTTLTLIYSTVSLPSWTAGSKQVSCSIGATLGNGGWSTLLNSAKGPLVINGQPPVAVPDIPQERLTMPPIPLPPVDTSSQVSTQIDLSDSRAVAAPRAARAPTTCPVSRPRARHRLPRPRPPRARLPHLRATPSSTGRRRGRRSTARDLLRTAWPRPVLAIPRQGRPRPAPSGRRRCRCRPARRYPGSSPQVPTSMSTQRFDELVSDALDRDPARSPGRGKSTTSSSSSRRHHPEEPDLLGRLRGGGADRTRLQRTSGSLPDTVTIFRERPPGHVRFRGGGGRRGDRSPSSTRSPITSASTTTACTNSVGA